MSYFRALPEKHYRAAARLAPGHLRALCLILRQREVAAGTEDIRHELRCQQELPSVSFYVRLNQRAISLDDWTQPVPVQPRVRDVVHGRKRPRVVHPRVRPRHDPVGCNTVALHVLRCAYGGGSRPALRARTLRASARTCGRHLDVSQAQRLVIPCVWRRYVRRSGLRRARVDPAASQ